MEKVLDMIDDLIKVEEKRDILFKHLALKANKASLALGESLMIDHLKNLRELVLKEWDNLKLKNIAPFIQTGVVNRNFDMIAPDAKITISPDFQYRGCVGTRYCFECKTIWGSTCQCIGGPCPRCKKGVMGTTPPDDPIGWESHNKESWLQSASQKNSTSSPTS